MDARALAAVCAPLEPMGSLGKCRLANFPLRRLGVNGNYITEEWSRLAEIKPDSSSAKAHFLPVIVRS